MFLKGASDKEFISWNDLLYVPDPTWIKSVMLIQPLFQNFFFFFFFFYKEAHFACIFSTITNNFSLNFMSNIHILIEIYKVYILHP